MRSVGRAAADARKGEKRLKASRGATPPTRYLTLPALRAGRAKSPRPPTLLGGEGI